MGANPSTRPRLLTFSLTPLLILCPLVLYYYQRRRRIQDIEYRAMAPAAKPNATVDKMKQKSLMSFFGKKDDADTKALPANDKPKPKPAVTETPAKETRLKHREKENPPSSPAPVKEVHTPMPKGHSESSGIASATYTRSSEGGSSVHDTPPTSDPIDVDMLSDADPSEALQSSAAKSVRKPCYASRHTRLLTIRADDESQEAEDCCGGLGRRPASKRPHPVQESKWSVQETAHVRRVLGCGGGRGGDVAG